MYLDIALEAQMRDWKKNIYYLSFWSWLMLLDVIISSWIHCPEEDMTLFFRAGNISTVYTRMPHFPASLLLATWVGSVT